MRPLVLLTSLGIGLAMLWPAPDARACGGLVTHSSGTVGMDAQRVFLSVRGGQTELVVQVNVPQTTDDYGVLIPLPAAPTIDGTPVNTGELDSLDQATRVRIFESSGGGGGGGGCGCLGASAKDGSNGPLGDAGTRGGVTVSDPVDIGPITAVSLTATDATAMSSWLSSNGFVIPAAHQALVDSYVGPGMHFLALKRNDTATPGTATSVGVHLTLAGDHRGYPLRLSRMGATTQLAVVVFVATTAAVGPAAPFTALTTGDLDRGILRVDGYAAAVAAAIAANGHQAFVVEGIYPRGELALGTGLSALTDPNQTITRLTAVFDPTQLTADVSFDGPPPASVSDTIYLSAPLGLPVVGGPHDLTPWLLLGIFLWLLGGLRLAVVRRRRQHAGA